METFNFNFYSRLFPFERVFSTSHFDSADGANTILIHSKLIIIGRLSSRSDKKGTKKVTLAYLRPCVLCILFLPT